MHGHIFNHIIILGNVGHLNIPWSIRCKAFKLSFHLAIRLRVGVSDNKVTAHIIYLMNN